MQYVDIYGGLGNQMFQYALYLSKKNQGYNVVPDISLFRSDKNHLMHNGFELDKLFNLNPSVVFHSSLFSQYVIKIALKLNLSFLISKDNVFWGYQEKLKNSSKLHLHGYWQSEKYFDDVAEQVRTEFVFKNIDQQNMAISQEMKDDSEYTSVSLHVRRGDYVNYNMKLLGKQYYEQSIDYIKSKVERPRFYIFSDDMKAAIDIVKMLDVAYIPISINSGADSYKDMFLMSQCKHNIIANSSFSWWGAWLNNNKDKIVVAPTWGKDFNCEKWIIINN
jgi:hypothetical protein